MKKKLETKNVYHDKYEWIFFFFYEEEHELI